MCGIIRWEILQTEWGNAIIDNMLMHGGDQKGAANSMRVMREDFLEEVIDDWAHFDG